MKKQFKAVLYVIAALTVICVIAAIVMLKVVSGDDLFYMDTKLGGFYVASYALGVPGRSRAGHFLGNILDHQAPGAQGGQSCQGCGSG